MPFKTKLDSIYTSNLNKRARTTEETTKEITKETKEIGTQVDESMFSSKKDEKEELSYPNQVDGLALHNIRDLISLMIDSCTFEWTSISHRILGIIIYVLLRFSSLKFEQIRLILRDLEALSINKCSGYVSQMIEEDDLCLVLNNKRGKYQRDSFYDAFPELEHEIKAFALERATQKQSSFSVSELSKFISQRFFFHY